MKKQPQNIRFLRRFFSASRKTLMPEYFSHIPCISHCFLVK